MAKRGRPKGSKNKKTTTKKNNKKNTKTPMNKQTVTNELIGILMVAIGVFLIYLFFSKDSGMLGNVITQVVYFLVGSVGTLLLGIMGVLYGGYIVFKFAPFNEGKGLIFVFLIIINILIGCHIGDMKFSALSIFDISIFSYSWDVITTGGFIGIFFGKMLTTMLSSLGAWIFIVATSLIYIVLLFRDFIGKYAEKQKEMRKVTNEEKEKIRLERLEKDKEEQREKIRNLEYKKAAKKQAIIEKKRAAAAKKLAEETGIPENPYDQIVLDEEYEKTKEEISKRWEREYKSSLEKDPVVNDYLSRTGDVYEGEYSEELEQLVYEEKNKLDEKLNTEIREEINKEAKARQDMLNANIDDADTIDFSNEVKNEIENSSPVNETKKELSGDIWAKNNDKNTQENDVIKSTDETKEKAEYVFPSAKLLNRVTKRENSRERKRVNENAHILEQTLDNFNIGASVEKISIGPTVTRYELQLKPGIKVNKVVNLADNIAMSLAAQGVRIEAPIPGKSAIGIEVPNKEVSIVGFNEIVSSEEFRNAKSNLSVALGTNITGETLIMDIAKLPHLLIAGATGSGKSVCVNAIINSILFHASPEDVKMILIDPKMVELNMYNEIPHLMIPVVTNPHHAAGALDWAVRQMKDRYEMFAQSRVRDINGYNEKMEELGKEKMPKIVIIIDELADLMMVSANQVEASICRLAQLARAAGIHLILATQRPSVDVITGLIKANIPSRISFAVTSQVDSRTILDTAGAEKLLGRGDMLYAPVGMNNPTRAQCAYISDSEVEKVVKFIKENEKAEYDEEIYKEITTVDPENNKGGGESQSTAQETDALLGDAINIAFELGQISTSMLQRRLRIGYARAGRIVDDMEQKGIISAADGSKPRKILVNKEDFYAEKMREDEERQLSLEEENE